MQLSLSELLQGKHESEFSSDELSAKAHEFRNDTSEPNYFLTGYSQAGIWFSRAGHFDEAKPLLEHSVEADWVGVGLRDDFYLARSCYLELLSEEAKTPSESMVALYEKARAHCEEMSWVFPNLGSPYELLANATTPLGRLKLAEEIENRRSRKDRQTRSRAVRSSPLPKNLARLAGQDDGPVHCRASR